MLTVSPAVDAISQPTPTAANNPTRPTKLYKSRIVNEPTDAICKETEEIGYDGIEVMKWNVPVAQARNFRLTAEKYNLRIHSVMRGWASFNSPDDAVRQKSIDETATAIQTASAMGADTILLVPCRTDVKPIPDPWNFNIEFDPKTLAVKKVVKGNNAQYADYINAQNAATEMSTAAINSLVPLAAKWGVRIAIENVWNNLWITPALYAAFVRRFDTPWVGAYFDMGNHTRYFRAEDYISALNSKIVRLHIKGYSVTEAKNKSGGGPGDWTAIDKASIDWKSVRKALDNIGYSGYVSVEEGNYNHSEYAVILDKFFNGEL